MRSPKQIAIDIFTGDDKVKVELEEMMGCKLEDMTTNQRLLGVAVLSAFEEVWNKEEKEND